MLAEADDVQEYLNSNLDTPLPLPKRPLDFPASKSSLPLKENIDIFNTPCMKELQLKSQKKSLKAGLEEVIANLERMVSSMLKL